MLGIQQALNHHLLLDGVDIYQPHQTQNLSDPAYHSA